MGSGISLEISISPEFIIVITNRAEHFLIFLLAPWVFFSCGFIRRVCSFSNVSFKSFFQNQFHQGCISFSERLQRVSLHFVILLSISYFLQSFLFLSSFWGVVNFILSWIFKFIYLAYSFSVVIHYIGSINLNACIFRFILNLPLFHLTSYI